MHIPRRRAVWKLPIKSSELIQRKENTKVPGDLALANYWKEEFLQKVAEAIWKSLNLPKRGDVTGVRFTAA